MVGRRCCTSPRYDSFSAWLRAFSTLALDGGHDGGTLTVYQPPERLRGRLLVLAQDVAVEVGGEADAAVPEALTDDFQGHAVVDLRRRGQVAQAVQRDGRQAGAGDCSRCPESASISSRSQPRFAEAILSESTLGRRPLSQRVIVDGLRPAASPISRPFQFRRRISSWRK